MELTIQQYNSAIDKCKDIFLKKTTDYGTAWRILRTSSLTDQIFIKANRIRTIQQTGESKINEGIEDEFVGIINYCVMALIQLELKDDNRLELDNKETIQHYQDFSERARDLMVQKNHDYGEAWRDMRVSSLTDLILMKILRVKQIENNSGKTLISEGIDANYYDMLNYAVFALIHLNNPS
ncbi:MAG: DUF1599 domain-containing protein [Bacteroidota bacterium]|nr:DUF1599 domain-containing protein [Bacteroidota bacterium]|tara:strand:- start:40 stop:582 length:543 start_codon:yes stop_codon:yes gene_type:complete